jgi:hypothetical protein
MRIETLMIQPIATAGAATEGLPQPALGARPARRLALAVTIFATTTAVLLASALAVMLNLS